MLPPDETFESLYRRHYGRVHRLLRSMGVPAESAEDLAQETFVRVYNRIDHYRGEAEWAYVETVARRVLFNDARSRATLKRSGVAVPLDDPDDPIAEMGRSVTASSDPASELLRTEAALQQRVRLERAVAELPSESKQALRLWLAGLKYSEIARVLTVSEAEVRNSLTYARRAIRRRTENVELVAEGADVLDAFFASDVIERVPLAPISAPSLIFDAPPPPIHVPQMIVSVEDALIEAIKREPQSIFAIPPRSFEKLVSDIFRSKGFETELTKATRDGGRDIIAVHEVLGIRAKYIIECKRYAPHRKVTLQLVQRLYGVKVAEGANKAILATTSSFTRDARQFAAHHVWDVELKSFEDILAWVREYRA